RCCCSPLLLWCFLSISIIKAEHALFGWKEDLKRHFLWVSDVEVAEDAEVCRGQGCDPASLDREACVVLNLEVRILSHHLHQQVTQQRHKCIINCLKQHH
uniref:Secreted protein n=1 Tax=Sparus aurata TaxID=8175 RepID=A0A671W670_SPAAU